MGRARIARRILVHSGTPALVAAALVSIWALPAAAGAPDGPISVSTPGGNATSAASFDVTSTPPAVNNFAPKSGAVGATVHIYGKGFSGATVVRFNGVSATPFTIVGPGNIQTTVPSGATTGRISVTTPLGTGTSAVDFVVSGGLAVTSFSPTAGSVGSPVSIKGTGFTNVSAVKFNGVSSMFTVVSAIRIDATVPKGASTGKIAVTTPQGTAISSGVFTVVPRITGLSPQSGGVGTSVTINGNSFTGVTSVRFDGVAASFSFVSVNRVDAVVPSGAHTGRVTLTTPAGSATSPQDFTVTSEIHHRSISLFLGRGVSRGRLYATGRVSVDDGYAACLRHVPVVIKRYHGGRWRWITTTSTGQNGQFRTRLADRKGRYRAKAIKIRLVNDAVCGGHLSNVVRHGR